MIFFRFQIGVLCMCHSLILSCDNGEKGELENAILDGYFDVWMVCCLYSEIYVSVFVPLKNVGADESIRLKEEELVVLIS